MLLKNNHMGARVTAWCILALIFATAAIRNWQLQDDYTAVGPELAALLWVGVAMACVLLLMGL